ncbi:MAG: ATP-grasp domain-containing protein, partial [Stellaceae bacterium]
ACATTLGYPLVLKRRFGFAGEGVAIVGDPDDLVRQGRVLLSPDQLDLGQRLPQRMLVQAFVRGAYHSQAITAWRGVSLAGFAWNRQVATLPCKGQTSVLRFVRSPETKHFTEALCGAFGISGLFSVQFVLDDGGHAYLLEINRRIVTHMHMGERVGADLGAALVRQLRGSPALPRVEPPHPSGPSVAIFPREWLRDPDSHWLRDGPVDVPWDEPDLIRLMLAMRH